MCSYFDSLFEKYSEFFRLKEDTVGKHLDINTIDGFQGCEQDSVDHLWKVSTDFNGNIILTMFTIIDVCS
mgnify:CR=1 FL=1